MDISKREDVENMIEITIKTFGRLDCAVNSAGIAGTLSLPTHEYPEAKQQAINFQRMKRMGQPQEVADVALWLCSDQSTFITGHAMAVDGGALA